ncbi:MAG: hypothetical protein REI96_09485 [Flavobacterium nitrogenifigens]|uniref:Uncharacterized protein n=1 Tax=Flavobacterium nitrogenifigens TaxID=1617283 RepID=A0A521DQS3_9FLAO|nr:hypothetical protein [Flavobacterium nitrogenifigens]KAF2327447.1 hypothetical protein DM397_18650 [Flavobacterium nitrogenifigens]MDQ8012668.1 hypothetical protein [Flavobacterium nitrogenifigens]SMO74046.1 hypothetical protein SAMN06265220_103338 [Flavobacterium nitrogenifigens]
MKTFKLENEPKIKSGFKTPENYFDDFSEKVLQQLNEKEVKVIPFYKRKKTLWTAAAAVVGFALLIPVINNYRANSTDLDEATLENYLSYHSNISQYDLIQKLDDSDIEKLGNDVTLEDETLEDILATSPNIEHLISEQN